MVHKVQYFDRRYYKVLLNNIEMLYPSVTEILSITPKPYLATWRGELGNDEANRVMNEAMDKGTIVHKGVETIVKGGIVVFNPYESPKYDTAQIYELEKSYPSVFVVRNQDLHIQIWRVVQFLEAVKAIGIDSERIVYSSDYGYAGTLDLIIDIPEDGEYMVAGTTPIPIKKGLYICDVKTGKTGGDSLEYQMQVSAYAKAYSVLAEKEVSGAIILHTQAQVKRGIEGFKATVLTNNEMNGRFREFLSVLNVYKIYHPVPKPKEIEFPAQLSYKSIEQMTLGL
jgi:hypothetical protein